MRTQFMVPSGPLAALDNNGVNGVSADADTVLLVPGYTGSKEDFQPLLRPLAAAGFRAIAIDQRGQYESGWATTADGYRLPALAADVIALAEQLDRPRESLRLLGHSFGGLVAREVVLARPDLFLDLVLMGSGPAALGGRRRSLLDGGEQILATGGMHSLWEHLQAQLRADPRYVRPAPALQAFLRERFLATDPVGLRVMGTQLREEPDRTAELAAVSVRTLVLHGESDDAWPPEVQSDMAARLSAQREVIPDAAHSPAVENPAATVAALTGFWRSA
jgi:pimeloyl-ACP methyl ester carboxylesterase